MTPRLYAATRTGGWLLRYDEGPDDGGSPFAVVIQTTPLAPAGIGGEAVFDLLHVAITHSLEDEATVRIVPIVSQFDPTRRFRTVSEKTPIDIALNASPGGRTQVTLKLGLSEPYLRGGVERFRTALRGEWIAFRITTPGALPAGDLIFDRLAIEATPIRGTMTQAANSA